MECTIGKNSETCACTYPCERRGKCCECVAYRSQVPGCFFSKEGERSYDRSINKFMQEQQP